MPKPSYILPDYLISGLKWKIENRCNFKIINKKSCRILANLIHDSINQGISENTLYRILLKKENTHSPYYHTLEILAKYLDYANWYELQKHLEDLYSFQLLSGSFERGNKNSKELSLLELNIYTNSFKPLNLFFSQFDGVLEVEKKYILGGMIYEALRKNPNRNLHFFKHFYNYPIVRHSFYELFADPDFKLLDYEYGLKYYLKGIKEIDSIGNLQDFVFANTLLLRHNFFKSNHAEVIKIGKLLYERQLISENDLAEIHLFPRIRFIFYRTFYLIAKGSFTISYFDSLLLTIEDLCSGMDYYEKRIVFHTGLDTFQFNNQLRLKLLDKISKLSPSNFQLVRDDLKSFNFEKITDFLNPNASTLYSGVEI